MDGEQCVATAGPERRQAWCGKQRVIARPGRASRPLTIERPDVDEHERGAPIAKESVDLFSADLRQVARLEPAVLLEGRRQPEGEQLSMHGGQAVRPAHDGQIALL